MVSASLDLMTVYLEIVDNTSPAMKRIRTLCGICIILSFYKSAILQLCMVLKHSANFFRVFKCKSFERTLPHLKSFPHII